MTEALRPVQNDLSSILPDHLDPAIKKMHKKVGDLDIATIHASNVKIEYDSKLDYKENISVKLHTFESTYSG